MRIPSQLVQNIQQLLAIPGVPCVCLIGRNRFGELRATDGMHQCQQKCITVVRCGISKQSDILLRRRISQDPHLIPGSRQGPAFLPEQFCIVNQSAGRIEHGCQIGFSVTVRRNALVVAEASGNFLRGFHILAGNGPGQGAWEKTTRAPGCWNSSMWKQISSALLQARQQKRPRRSIAL